MPDQSAPKSPRDDNCFVGLALSGGGSRSANFSAACMFQLERIDLLDRVDYISSVSGGSLAGAYYCLSDDKGWNNANVQRKLTHSFANDVIIQCLLPWNMVALAFTDFDRTDLLADSFTNTLFRRNGRELKFGDLRKDRPHLLINATDLQTGRAFVFRDDVFDEINSDLAKYPISHAVAASAAVPVVMNQVTLRDFSTIFKRFRHLVDGGVYDNLGITTLVDTFEGQVAAALHDGLPDPYPNGALLIVVDARTRFDAKLDEKGDVGLIESLAAGAAASSSSLINRVSTATMAEIIVRESPGSVTAEQLRNQIDVFQRDGFMKLKDRRGHDVTVVHLALSRVSELSNLPSQGFFQRLNDIATFFNISPAEAVSLYLAADLLFKQKFEAHLREAQQRQLGSRRTP
ncbi:MAG: patatin-like phospholipase family protein [Anaerolineae bacterium]|nr:patatin-like phospholipase family protein [Phycisphaerae bacterium]